ncbi:hypothetical protein DOTSEDRAFT_72864 [Dothistroma septosporum NZE10]|uniref:Uncharacterized protein n=1 Tax=Dothistroma septosporum (strain NZE10 / CBS 128990) TaxID=675120 RepID=M2Y5V6_DOTSN|nr:hypothetical protein DOTSEDRAFT_72864 [Dothistroma septosporum NZE10]
MLPSATFDGEIQHTAKRTHWPKKAHSLLSDVGENVPNAEGDQQLPLASCSSCKHGNFVVAMTMCTT